MEDLFATAQIHFVIALNPFFCNIDINSLGLEALGRVVEQRSLPILWAPKYDKSALNSSIERFLVRSAQQAHQSAIQKVLAGMSMANLESQCAKIQREHAR